MTSARHDIGWAVKELHDGRKVRRAGWNGNGMFLLWVKGDATAVDGAVTAVVGDVRMLPWIGMKTADGGFVPWLCSQTDLLALDWEPV